MNGIANGQGRPIRNDDQPREFAITVRIDANVEGGARIRKLRAWLKWSLRSFGVRCITIAPAIGTEGDR